MESFLSFCIEHIIPIVTLFVVSSEYLLLKKQERRRVPRLCIENAVLSMDGLDLCFKARIDNPSERSFSVVGIELEYCPFLFEKVAGVVYGGGENFLFLPACSSKVHTFKLQPRYDKVEIPPNCSAYTYCKKALEWIKTVNPNSKFHVKVYITYGEYTKKALCLNCHVKIVNKETFDNIAY